MARSLNKVMLIGYPADEPQVRLLGQNAKVANFTLVTNERQRNNETGNLEDVPEWHRLVVWNRLADVVEQYVHKGVQVYVEGKIRTRNYTDKTGVKRYITEIICDQLILLGGRNSAAGSHNTSGTATNYGPGGNDNEDSYGPPQGPATSWGPTTQDECKYTLDKIFAPGPTVPVGNGPIHITPPSHGINVSSGFDSPRQPSPSFGGQNVAPAGGQLVGGPWAQDAGTPAPTSAPSTVQPAPENGGGDDDIPF